MDECQGCESLMGEMDRMANEIDQLRAGLVEAAPEKVSEEDYHRLKHGAAPEAASKPIPMAGLGNALGSLGSPTTSAPEITEDDLGPLITACRGEGTSLNPDYVAIRREVERLTALRGRT